MECGERLEQSEPPRYLFEVPNLTSLLGAGSSAASACWAAGHWGAGLPVDMPLHRPCVPPSIPSPEARAAWSPAQAPCSLLFSAAAPCADWRGRTPRHLARAHPAEMTKRTQPRIMRQHQPWDAQCHPRARYPSRRYVCMRCLRPSRSMLHVSPSSLVLYWPRAVLDAA